MKKVYVFGSFVMDHTTRCNKMPRDGESIFGESFQVSFGGKGINQAMMLKRLGADVSMIGALGKDKNGEEFKKLLIDNNFDINNIFFKDVVTGVSNIIIDATGQNRIIVVLGANEELTSEDVLSLENKIEENSIFLIQNEIPMTTIETIVHLGNKKHATIVLNPAPYKEINEETLNLIDYITPNENEATDLFKLDKYNPDEILKSFDKLKTKCLVMTIGDKGAIYYDHKNVIKCEPFKVDVIDTVGAGDAFNGGFVYGLANNFTINDCLKLANTCGALTIQKKGALVSQPNKKEVENFLKKH